MFHLTRTDGPPCARCGCRDTAVSAEPQTISIPGSSPWTIKGRASCRYCGNRFEFSDEVKAAPQADELPPIRVFVVPAIPCPDCGSENTRVSSSPKAKGEMRTRYHKCDECGHRFKTAMPDQSSESDLHTRAV